MLQLQYDTEWSRWFHENLTVTSCAAARRTIVLGQNACMKIQLNGEPRPIPQGTYLTNLLADEGLAERRIAVEVNGFIVPRAQHPHHLLHDGDRIEIVHALGGG